MKICVAQTKPIKGDIQKNIENHIGMIKLAVSEEADVIIFPELSLTGYEPELAQKLAVNKDDIRFDDFQKISSVDQIIIGVGLPIKNGSGVSISMLIFHPDKERQIYFKQYLYSGEEEFFISGNNLTNLIYGESIAPAICYELSVPMHSERAFKRGAAFYIASVVESVEGVDTSIEKLTMIAKKYSMTVFMSNCIGKTGVYNTAGKTSIWNKKGELLKQLSDNEEGVLILDTSSNKTIFKKYNMSSCNTSKKETTSCSITDNGCKTSDSKEHLGEYWCSMYTDVDVTKLGWYEEKSSPSLKLIKKTKLAKDAKQFHVGAGSTTLIDSLVEDTYTNLIVNDISSCALNKIKNRIGEKQEAVEWIVDDLVNPTALENMPKVDLWNDRAVLHFFTEEKDQETYFKLLNAKVKKNGFVILSVFNLEGATKCSGLDVKRYNAIMLQEKLGEDYRLLESFNHIYSMPNGEDRPYVYTLFQRIS